MSEKYFEIPYLNLRGSGIARDHDGIITVPGAIPGETLRLDLLECARNRRVGRITEILVASDQRIKPECSRFPGCPGCQLRHIRHHAQIDYALQRLQRISQKEGIRDLIPTIAEHQSIPLHKNYRVRCSTLPFIVDGELCLGMKSIYPDQRPIELRFCPNHHPALNTLIGIMSDFLNQDDILKMQVTGIREIMFHLSSDGRHRITIVCIEKHLNLDLVRSMLKRDFNDTGFSVLLLVLKSWGCGIEFKMPEIVTGDAWITLETPSGSCRVLPSVWTPVSLGSLEQLLETVRKDVPASSLSLLEIGCGAGLMTIPLASNLLTCVGIDKNRFAVQSACVNGDAHVAKTVSFRVGEAVHGMKKLAILSRRFTTVVVHGMRKPFGAELFQFAEMLGAETLILISPSAGAWIQDVHHVLTKGWRFNRLKVCDQIPHTMQFLFYGCLRRHQDSEYHENCDAVNH